MLRAQRTIDGLDQTQPHVPDADLADRPTVLGKCLNNLGNSIDQLRPVKRAWTFACEGACHNFVDPLAMIAKITYELACPEDGGSPQSNIEGLCLPGVL